ncbi:NTR, putative, partial [Plasmodium yoelii yoelii]
MPRCGSPARTVTGSPACTAKAIVATRELIPRRIPTRRRRGTGRDGAPACPGVAGGRSAGVGHGAVPGRRGRGLPLVRRSAATAPGAAPGHPAPRPGAACGRRPYHVAYRHAYRGMDSGLRRKAERRRHSPLGADLARGPALGLPADRRRPFRAKADRCSSRLRRRLVRRRRDRAGRFAGDAGGAAAVRTTDAGRLGPLRGVPQRCRDRARGAAGGLRPVPCSDGETRHLSRIFRQAGGGADRSPGPHHPAGRDPPDPTHRAKAGRHRRTGNPALGVDPGLVGGNGGIRRGNRHLPRPATASGRRGDAGPGAVVLLLGDGADVRLDFGDPRPHGTADAGGLGDDAAPPRRAGSRRRQCLRWRSTAVAGGSRSRTAQALRSRPQRREPGGAPVVPHPGRRLRGEREPAFGPSGHGPPARSGKPRQRHPQPFARRGAQAAGRRDGPFRAQAADRRGRGQWRRRDRHDGDRPVWRQHPRGIARRGTRPGGTRPDARRTRRDTASQTVPPRRLYRAGSGQPRRSPAGGRAAGDGVAIPLSLLGAFVVLQAFGVSLNLMVLGGLAIALGEVVDDAIIDTENIFRRLRENRATAAPRPALTGRLRGITG